MALTGTRLNEPFPWTSATDKGPEKDRSVFTFVLPSANIRAMIFDNVLTMGQDDNGRFVQSNRNGWRNIELMRFCLKGITNFNDPDGKKIEYATQDRMVDGVPYKNTSDDYISRIPLSVLNEAATMIVDKLTLEATLAKK